MAACNCEHFSHFADADGHARHFPNMENYSAETNGTVCFVKAEKSVVAEHVYMQAESGVSRMMHVGPICDDCANGHSAKYLVPAHVLCDMCDNVAIRRYNGENICPDCF